MANARAENFPVYLAEGACNASQQADALLLTEPSANIQGTGAVAFQAANQILANFLLQTTDYTSARAE
jgi:conjugal transfer/entry exclusion protein